MIVSNTIKRKIQNPNRRMDEYEQQNEKSIQILKLIYIVKMFIKTKNSSFLSSALLDSMSMK